MANKAAAAATLPKNSASALKAETAGKKVTPRLMAEIVLTPEFRNAATALKYASGEFDFTELWAVMRDKTAQVNAGNLTGPEATLTAQAVLLDGIFNEMARRAAANMGENLHAMETYLRLALKAQSQCRTTIEAIAEIKNPRPVAFVRQQNVAVNQQVNNGTQAVNVPRAREEKTIPANELSGVSHELSPDTGTSAPAGRNNPPLEAVGALHRATD